MSDEQLDEFDVEGSAADLETSEEYEEISIDEVDSVLESLEELAKRVTSENIKTYLEEASQQIYELVYEDEEEDEAADGEEGELEDDEILEDEILDDEDEEDLAAEAA